MELCKICKRDGDRFVEPHHIIPIWLNAMDNKGVDSCRQCHMRLHAFIHREALKLVFKLDKDFFFKCLKKFKNNKEYLLKYKYKTNKFIKD